MDNKEVWTQFACASMTTLAPWIAKELSHYNQPQDMDKLAKMAALMADAMMKEWESR